jgi:hypothetical protein
MKKIVLITLMVTGFVNAAKYEITHIKRGGAVNVRDVPFKNQSVVVDKIAFNTTGISIKECTELEDGSEWCYIYAPRGASHVEGWVNSHFLKKMSKKEHFSKAHITNFLYNFYKADEENYMDKLQVFYAFPMQRYMRHRNLSLMELRAKKIQFYKRWSKRHYRLTHLKILKRKPTYIDVQTTVRWRIEGHNDYKKGKDIQKLRLVPVENTFKVSALKTLKHIVFPKPVEPQEAIVDNKKAIVDKNSTRVVREANRSGTKKEVTPDKLAALAHKFYIKSGSFFSEISPNYLQRIHDNRFSYLIQKVRQGDKVIRRVFIGPFNSIEEAKEALVTVRAKINEFAYIQRNVRFR